MSTARMTLGALFGAVQATAQTVTTAVSAANQGMTQLAQNVETMAQKRQFRQAGDLQLFKEETLVEFNKRQVQVSLDAASFCKTSEAHKDLYLEADAKFRKLLGMAEA